MIIKPRIRGFICTTAHPVGCAANVGQQIGYVREQGKLETGAPIRVYQLLLVEKERTILLQGLVSEDRGDRFVPQFREVAMSLRKTD